MKIRLSRGLGGAAALTAVMAVLILPGCGTARYEERLAQTVDAIRKRALFDPLNLGLQVGESPIYLGLPKFFNSPITVDTMPEGQVGKQRVKLPFPDLGAFASAVSTYEGFVPYSDDTGRGQIAFYMYWAAIKLPKGNRLLKASPAPDGMDGTGQVYQGIKQAFPKFAGAWKEVSFPRPDGSPVKWQELELTGEQEFACVDPQNEQGLRKTSGLVQVFARIEAEHLVLVVWRIPKLLVEAQATVLIDDKPVELTSLAPLVAGSIATATN